MTPLLILLCVIGSLAMAVSAGVMGYRSATFTKPSGETSVAALAFCLVLFPIMFPAMLALTIARAPDRRAREQVRRAAELRQLEASLLTSNRKDHT